MSDTVISQTESQLPLIEVEKLWAPVAKWVAKRCNQALQQLVGACENDEYSRKSMDLAAYREAAKVSKFYSKVANQCPVLTGNLATKAIVVDADGKEIAMSKEKATKQVIAAFNLASEKLKQATKSLDMNPTAAYATGSAVLKYCGEVNLAGKLERFGTKSDRAAIEDGLKAGYAYMESNFLPLTQLFHERFELSSLIFGIQLDALAAAAATNIASDHRWRPKRSYTPPRIELAPKIETDLALSLT